MNANEALQMARTDPTLAARAIILAEEYEAVMGVRKTLAWHKQMLKLQAQMREALVK